MLKGDKVSFSIGTSTYKGVLLGTQGMYNVVSIHGRKVLTKVVIWKSYQPSS